MSYIKCPQCHSRMTRKYWTSIKEVDYGEWDINIKCRCKYSFTHHESSKKFNRGGYIYISIPRFGSSYLFPSEIPEHRYVWERQNGKLPDSWIVHHINGIKADNRIENLVALPKKDHNNNMQKWGRDKFLVTCPFCNRNFSTIGKIINGQ